MIGHVLVACRDMQVAKIIEKVTGRSIEIEPDPKVLYRIQFRRVGWLYDCYSQRTPEVNQFEQRTDRAHKGTAPQPHVNASHRGMCLSSAGGCQATWPHAS